MLEERERESCKMKFICTSCNAVLYQTIKRYKEQEGENLRVVTSIDCPLCGDMMIVIKRKRGRK